MLMSACLPVSIHPRIVAKGGCVFQLGFGDSGSVTLQRSVVFQRRPGYRVVAVRQPEKAAEAHDSICHAARDLLYEEVINRTDSLISDAVYTSVPCTSSLEISLRSGWVVAWVMILSDVRFCMATSHTAGSSLGGVTTSELRNGNHRFWNSSDINDGGIRSAGL